MIFEESIMKEDESNSSYEEKLEKEYAEAVLNGFTGTIEEYKSLRDFT